MRNFFNFNSKSPAKKRSRSRLKETNYQKLEPKNLLTTLTVTTTSDVVDLNDGLISLREAIFAANDNAAYGDAAAGDVTGDVIQFDPSIAGGTIELNGSEIEISDDVVIRGNAIAIDANLMSRVFTIDTEEAVTISNLTFQNGEADSNGGAINHVANGTLRLSNVHFTNNVSSGFGGAIYAAEGELRIGNSTFDKNNSSQGGGAIAVVGDVKIFRTRFENNSAFSDGGAVHSRGSNFSSIESTYVDNVAQRSGGAVHTTNGSFAIFSENVIEGNRSNSFGGGGLSFISDTQQPKQRTFIFSSTFTSNVALSETTRRFGFDDTSFLNGSGGAIHNLHSDLVVRNSTITKSVNFEGYGGGIFSLDGNVRLLNTQIFNNRSGVGGGGLRISRGNLVLIDSEIIGNKLLSSANSNNTIGASFNDRIGYGGGIEFIGNLFDASEYQLVARNSTFSENETSNAGGAISIHSSDSSSISDSIIDGNTVLGDGDIISFGGGGIFLSGSELDISRSTISANRALAGEDFENPPESGLGGGGGGISTRRSVLNVGESEIVSNFTSANGGGVNLFRSQASFLNTQIGSEDNGGNIAGSRELSQDAFWGNGGGIYVDDGRETISVIGGAISNNTAANRGGGLYFSADQSPEVPSIIVSSNPSGQGTLIFGNRARQFDGGGVYLSDTTGSTFRDTVFEENLARSGAAVAGIGDALDLENVSNINNTSRRDDNGFHIEENDSTQTAAAFAEVDIAISKFDLLSDFV